MMSEEQSYFFCGIGGSGMLPLAAIVRGMGYAVAGSDRSRDQGRMSQKFAYLEGLGVTLFPQDGSGLTSAQQTLVASAAVEETVPDVAAARAVGATRVTRAQLLSTLFNAAPLSVGVAGTSGKSTVTAMIAWILHQCGRAPTVMNGAVMKNFAQAQNPFASALVGKGELFVSEIDESDGSIALYAPRIAVINNIALDHKTMDELRVLFADFAQKARHVVLNLDNAETALLYHQFKEQSVTYGIDHDDTDLTATDLAPAAFSIAFTVRYNGLARPITLPVPGRHNVSNALAAIATAMAAGVSLDDAANALQKFQGVKRRFECVGKAGGVTVIDDFAHNPDKIAATLQTLRRFDGRLLVMFQPHGFGPLNKMGDEIVDAFVAGLGTDDRLYMPQPVYYGGTVDRRVTSSDIVADVVRKGRHAVAFDDRDQCGEAILADAKNGDRVVVMGARDDTLSLFAQSILDGLTAQSQPVMTTKTLIS